LSRAGDLVPQRGAAGDREIRMSHRVGVDLPAGRDQPPDAGTRDPPRGREVGEVEVEYAGPVPGGEDRKCRADVAPVPVVEREDDRSGGKRGAAVPGVDDAAEGHGLVARASERAHMRP
jgi:hypothetical protein